MKLAVGKFYRGRDGDKIEVVYIAPQSRDTLYPVVGLNEANTLIRYSLEGLWYPYEGDSAFDLVAEWIDPPAPKSGRLAYFNAFGGTLHFIDSTEGMSAISPNWERMPHLDEPETK